jgi:hypothetical protein
MDTVHEVPSATQSDLAQPDLSDVLGNTTVRLSGRQNG